jgi:cobalt-zinc-cadmium efflux system outer membrane protein
VLVGAQIALGGALAWAGGEGVAPAAVQADRDATAQVYDLPAVVELALQHNPAVAGAEGALQQSHGRRIEAEAYPNPSITGQTGGGAIRDPSTGTSINEYLVTLTQPLEWPGKRAARRRAAERGVLGAGAGMDEVRVNLVADVKAAFYGLLLAQLSTEIAQKNLETVQEVARAVRARVESGEGAQFEAVKANVEVLKAGQEVTRARNAVRVGRVALDTLTAGKLGRAFEIRGDFRAPQSDLDLKRLTAQALERHPTIQRLRRLVERAEYTVVKEQQSRVPDVTVYGGYARETGREAVVGGLTIPTPIWYQRQGEITTALGAKRADEAEWMRARNELTKAVNQYVQEAETAAEQIAVFDKGLLKQAQEALRIARLSFLYGAASLLDVLDAQRVSRQVQWEYAQARMDLSLALTRLERALGGPL